MDLRGHLGVLRRGAPVILVLTIVSIGIALLVSGLLPRVYESRATLYVGQALDEPQLDYGGLLASQILTQTYARLATTRPIVETVIQDQRLAMTPEELQADLSTEVALEGTLLVVIAHSDEPERAARIANAIAEQVLALAPKEDPAAIADQKAQRARLDTAIGRVEAEIDVLLDLPNPTETQSARLNLIEERLVALQQARAALVDQSNAGSPNALTLIDPATATSTPVAPSRALIVAGSAAAALAVAILIAYLLSAFRPPPFQARG